MGEIREVAVPDIGGFDAVDVIDVLVAPGDRVAADDSLITLESDKASMDVPSPAAGVVREIKVKKGDKVGEGALILILELGEGQAPAKAEPSPKASPREAEPDPPAEAPPREAEPARAAEPAAPPPEARAREARTEQQAAAAEPSVPPPGATPAPGAEAEATGEEAFARAYASPAVRRFARELGVDLGAVQGSGRKGRIVKEDVQGFVKRSLGGEAPAAGAGIPPMPAIDFSRFGPVETRPLSRIRRATAANLHRAWLHVPHVTQHDEADITDLEAFRQATGEEVKGSGVKLTFLPFLVKAVVAALAEFPDFNSSLAPDGASLVVKRYFHIGVAVDTPEGLVVPVVRNADGKGLVALAREIADLAARAREGKLKIDELAGASFSISSLGGLGGTAFTPIVNAPEVAILGVSRSATRPVWRVGAFQPRLLLPLSLSYDHRVIDGAAAVRFLAFLGRALTDLRRLLL